MRFIMFAAFLLALAGPVLAGSGKMSYAVSPGYSNPFGGEWAKSYKSAQFISVGAEYDNGGEFRKGVELGYDFGHDNKLITKCSPKIFYVAPYLKEMRISDKWEYYGVIGIGVYNRLSNRYTDAGVTYKGGPSGKLGINGGFGFAYHVTPGLKLGFDLRVHHIIKFIGIGPQLVDANNLVPTLTLQKTF